MVRSIFRYLEPFRRVTHKCGGRTDILTANETANNKDSFSSYNTVAVKQSLKWSSTFKVLYAVA